MHNRGAYLLYLKIQQSISLDVGMLGRTAFPSGFYIYVGSAVRGIEQRIARHRRLALQKTGKSHWHIDFLLTHPEVRLIMCRKLEGSMECYVSKAVASAGGVTVGIPNFGSTDCKSGCGTHLYRVSGRTALKRLSKYSFSTEESMDAIGVLSKSRKTHTGRRTGYG